MLPSGAHKKVGNPGVSAPRGSDGARIKYNEFSQEPDPGPGRGSGSGLFVWSNILDFNSAYRLSYLCNESD